MARYIEASWLGDNLEIRFKGYPESFDKDYIGELSQLSSGEAKLVIIKLPGGVSTPFTTGCEVDPESVNMVRNILSTLIFRDSIYVAFVEGDLTGHPLEILLASDYVVPRQGSWIGFGDYIPLASGYSYSMFKGGNQLLNMLIHGVEIGRLCASGLLRCREGIETLGLESALALKAMDRERFLRDYQHLLRIEERIYRRLWLRRRV